MRAIWSGALGFGLVNIPVKLYSATEDHSLQFNFLHKKDLSPIRYAKVCKNDGKEITYDDVVRGYEYQKGDYIILDEEDFKRANARKTKSIDIVDFAKENEIDSIYFEKPYFLEPDKGAEKPYALLREAIKKSKKVGVARFVIRNREHLGVIKPFGKVIVLEQMRFKDEIRQPEGLKIPKKESLKPKELDMALALINQLSEPFKPEQYKDTYTEELKEVIKEKAHGKKPKKKGKEPQTTEVSELMEMLRASLQKQKQKVKA
jgi:DNA end-binding protein Ku